MILWLKEQWYRCTTCGYNFPSSEIGDHQGHKFFPIA